MRKKIDRTTIGGRISGCRHDLHLTQEQLAELMGITGAVVCCYEKDKVDLPISVIKELAKYLQVSVAYLADGVEDNLEDQERELLRIFGSVVENDRRIFLIEQMKAFSRLK